MAPGGMGMGAGMSRAAAGAGSSFPMMGLLLPILAGTAAGFSPEAGASSVMLMQMLNDRRKRQMQIPNSARPAGPQPAGSQPAGSRPDMQMPSGAMYGPAGGRPPMYGPVGRY